jgi:hypothetical protein
MYKLINFLNESKLIGLLFRGGLFMVSKAVWYVLLGGTIAAIMEHNGMPNYTGAAIVGLILGAISAVLEFIVVEPSKKELIQRAIEAAKKHNTISEERLTEYTSKPEPKVIDMIPDPGLNHAYINIDTTIDFAKEIASDIESTKEFASILSSAKEANIEAPTEPVQKKKTTRRGPKKKKPVAVAPVNEVKEEPKPADEKPVVEAVKEAPALSAKPAKGRRRNNKKNNKPQQ